MAEHPQSSGTATAAPALTYAVVIEWGPHNYSAYVPDLPGCVSTGKTAEETIRNIRAAMAGHLAVMREYGDPIPEPRTRVAMVSVSVDADAA
ncbi:MAG TPA: type II toxin-antitoxin system HicB family antitoxin [Thermomicrobiales bacterium]|nr:type II toxin-antitoxin system HicB family antitoxin [Thermomicrobiales bacterium]